MLLHVSLWSASNELLYNSCRFCHGEEGQTEYLGKVAPIKRLDKTTLIALLQGYQKGEIDQIGLGKLMQAQVKHFDDAQIEQLATYITSF